MRVEPAIARYSVESSDSLFRVTIPARSHFLVVLMWFAWLCALVVAGARPHGMLRTVPSSAFELITFAIWTGLALTGLASILWIVLGREVVTISGNTLVCRICIGGIGYSRKYALADTNSYRISLRYAALCGSYRLGGLPVGPNRGTIHFECHGSTRYLGAGLDETEANHVFALLKPLVDARPRRTRSGA
jgi:hypothetical protein